MPCIHKLISTEPLKPGKLFLGAERSYHVASGVVQSSKLHCHQREVITFFSYISVKMYVKQIRIHILYSMGPA